MPREGRHSLSVYNEVYETANKRFKAEKEKKRLSHESKKYGFTEWVSEYILMNLEKDKLLQQYAPFLSKIGVENNTLFIKDSKENKIIEITMKDGKIQSSDSDPLYTQFAWALPELSYLKNR